MNALADLLRAYEPVYAIIRSLRSTKVSPRSKRYYRRLAGKTGVYVREIQFK